ncbi:hypothetical protein D0860_02094 [Hortaea werneckii]|uniref:RING-type domain-containing protein n=1 Tax=Hortaea werneckii TaxID=91943 RepID=A0A3M7HMB5_HORWE|nr:hypothetical protein D0860_02094 [Hortaea werneckii]
MHTDPHHALTSPLWDRRTGHDRAPSQAQRHADAGLLGSEHKGREQKPLIFQSGLRAKSTRDGFSLLAPRHPLRVGSSPSHSAEQCKQPQRSNHKRLSSLAQLKDHRNSMFAGKGRESRRERTFIGSECAACEEPLEHTLRGERILQLSCGHVSHEACFYEYIKEFEAQSCPSCNAPLGVDTSRGAGIDFENLNKLVRQAQTPDPGERFRDTESTASAWETDTVRHNVQTRQRQQQRNTRDHLLPDQMRAMERRFEPAYSTGHGRNESADTGKVSTNDYAETHHTARRHDYDVQSMETSLSSPRHIAKNPIPAPTVTVRSEFPTLSKSRQQQSLTCLVTVEVIDGKWQPDPDDLRSPRSAPSAIHEETYERPRTHSLRKPQQQRQAHHENENTHALQQIKQELYTRVDNWHGLDFERFGKLLLHGIVRVGKDRQAWQELECYLFSEMLICVKEKKSPTNASQQWDADEESEPKSRCTLKGSILIKRHLKQVETATDEGILTLSLSVAELPQFHLQFKQHHHLDVWRRALMNLNRVDQTEPQPADLEQDTSGTDEEDYTTQASGNNRRVSSVHSSSNGASRSHATALTEYSNSRGPHDIRPGMLSSIHVPLDILIVVPVTPSMQGLKMNLLRDALRFMVSNLGERDRMGLVTFGSGTGSMPLVGMTNKSWAGWGKALDSIRPTAQKSMRADVVEGANVAMDLLMQRKSANPLSTILLISDSAASDQDSVDFVVSRAEAAKVAIHSFGLGLTHKPDTMVELSTRTKASYTYVRDWMMLRECMAGCLGAMQSTSHQNVRLKLRLPEGSPAKFVKISGALQITKRATGRDAEAMLGDLRFGDKRDILVQLAIAPDTSTPDHVPTDPWENVIAGLEALGGPIDSDDSRTLSVEELPLIQADLSWGDILREGNLAHLPRPSLLAITMLPSSARKGSQGRPASPPIPPHPSIVQRRMELLTSDMLSRALTLVGRGQNDRASHLLAETRSILKGLGKGGLPPLPPPPSGGLPPTPKTGGDSRNSPTDSAYPSGTESRRTPSPPRPEPLNPFTPAAGIDTTTMSALDAELEAALEWISHPAVFGRDSRKSVLQAIGVISSQRGFTFRSASEALWAARIPGVKRLADCSREWREAGDESLMEEA